MKDSMTDGKFKGVGYIVVQLIKLAMFTQQDKHIVGQMFDLGNILSYLKRDITMTEIWPILPLHT